MILPDQPEHRVIQYISGQAFRLQTFLYTRSMALTDTIHCSYRYSIAVLIISESGSIIIRLIMFISAPMRTALQTASAIIQIRTAFLRHGLACPTVLSRTGETSV